MTGFRTAAMVMLVMLTGCSSQPEFAGLVDREPAGRGLARSSGQPTGAAHREAAESAHRVADSWPDPDLRAGLNPTSRIGVRARPPLARTTRPRCTMPKDLAGSIERRRPEQVLLVTAHGTRARVTGCERVDNRYLLVLGPFPARVGRHGTAARGEKREGDGRTPSGVFTLHSGFGTAKNPGLANSFGWFEAGSADVWVDDPRSGLYNTHQVGPARGRWHSAEKLRIRPYRTAQVIGYNRARTPGRGSAIFLHVGTGGPTAGCVSLEAGRLRAVMRWERAGAVIAIS